MIDWFQNEYVGALVILVGFIAVAKVIHILVVNFISRWLKDEGEIMRSVERPVHGFIIIVGLYFALKQLSITLPYWHIVRDSFMVLFVLIGAVITARLLEGLIDKWLQVTRRYERIPQVINKVVSVVIYTIALAMILAHFEVEITPLIATLGLGGLAVGLALQNTLSNFFAGLHIVSDRPIAVGHFIELDSNVSGYVEDIGWRSTRIRTFANNIVIVPNGKLSESIITNDSMPQNEMSAYVPCGVSYKSNLDKVEKVTLRVAKKILKSVDGAVEDYEPKIFFKEFGDSNINFTVVLRVKTYRDSFMVKHEFIKALKKEYDKEKIEISWPVRKIVKGK